MNSAVPTSTEQYVLIVRIPLEAKDAVLVVAKMSSL